MSNGRNKRQKAPSGRDGGGFVAMPWSVLDSSAYARLSHPAKALLMEFARQYIRDNNGRLLCSTAYLRPRGWKSADVIHRAKAELVAAGFIHETVRGHRPNKASWYAVTWYALDKMPGYDYGAAESFERSKYRKDDPLKNASLNPSGGTGKPSIVPSPGIRTPPPSPSGGAMRRIFQAPPVPSGGHHLDMPSVGA